MNLLKFLIHSNIFISIAALVFTAANALLMNIQLSELASLFIHIFFSTWLVYQWSRKLYWEKMKAYPNRDEIYIFQHKYQLLTKYSIILSFIITCITFLLLKNQTKIFLLFIGFVSILYALPLNKLGIHFRVRDIPFLKIFLIAFTWSFVLTYIPALESKTLFVLFDNYTWKFFIAQFTFILFITLPFDMVDIKNDKYHQLKTIPIFIGLKYTKILLVLLCFLYIFLLYIIIEPKILFVSLALVCLLLLFVSLFFSNQFSKTQIMLIYDGSMIVYSLIVFFFFYFK